MNTLILPFKAKGDLIDQLISEGYEIKYDENNIHKINGEEIGKLLDGNLKVEEKFIVFQPESWKIIPLENLIAYSHSHSKYIGTVLESPDEIPLLTSILEKGVDAVYIKDYYLLEKSIGYLLRKDERLSVKDFKIKSIEDGGSGNRACVDTITIMRPDEGIFVGSFSKNMVLVLSESSENDFINERPFRVNSGAIHQYVYIGDGKTKYLSEIKAGEKIKIFKHNGDGRKTTVGRSKIEFRPMVKVTYAADREEGNVFLQNAETVRLMKSNGTPVSINEIKEGDLIRGIALEGARHYGMKINEKLIEQ